MYNATENKGPSFASAESVFSIGIPEQYVPPSRSSRSSRAGTVTSVRTNASDQVEYLWPIDPVLANLRFFNPDASTKQVSKSSLFAKYAYEYGEDTREILSMDALNRVYRSFEKALKFIFQTLKNTSFATVYDFAKFMSNCIISMTDDFAQLEEVLFKIQTFFEDVEKYGSLKMKAFNFVRNFNMLCAFLDYYHYEDIQMVFLSSYSLQDNSKTALYLDFNKLCDAFYESWLVLYDELLLNENLIVGPAPFVNTSSLTNSDTIVRRCKKKFINEHAIHLNDNNRVRFANDSVYKVIKIPSGKDKCRSIRTFYLNDLINENDRLKRLHQEFALSSSSSNAMFSEREQTKLTVSKCVLFLIHENSSCYCVDNFKSVYQGYSSNYHMHYSFSLFACLEYLAKLRCNPNFFRNVHYLNQASMFLLTYQIYISPKNLLAIMLQTVFESLDVAIDKTDELLFYENKDLIRVRNWSVLLLDVLHNVFAREIDRMLYLAFWLLHYRLSQLGLIKLAFELRFILLNFSLASPDDSHFTFEENFVRLNRPFNLANTDNNTCTNNEISNGKSLAEVIRSLMKKFTAKEFAMQICLQDENLFRLINPSELVSYSLCKSDFYDDSFDMSTTNMSINQNTHINCSKGTSSIETENNENLEKANNNNDLQEFSKGASFICEANNENYLKCKNVIKFIDRFNKISSLIIILFSRSHIVSSKLAHLTDLDFLAKRKTEKLVLYLSTCLHFLLKFRNMNAFFAVGLIFVRYIHKERFIKIVKRHPKYAAKHPLIEYSTLDFLMDSANSYHVYRKVLAESVRAPFIPHMAIILHDLNFYITEAQRNYFKKKHFLMNLLNDEKLFERFFGVSVDIDEDDETTIDNDSSKNSSLEFTNDQILLNDELKTLFDQYKCCIRDSNDEEDNKLSIYNWKVGWQLYSCIFQSFVLAQKDSYEFTENVQLNQHLTLIEQLYEEEKKNK